MIYSANELIERSKQVNGFKNIPSDYWIIGVRSFEDKPNEFDDIFYLMRGKKLVMWTTGTTNPGTPVLKGGFLKYNRDGAAVVEADRWYYNVWLHGLHAGKIPALLQRGAKIVIWRDGDKDGKSEEQGKRTEGYYGINFHPDQYNVNAPDKDSNKINGWSAGCQVCNKIEDYNRIILATKNQSRVTYLLLNEFSV